MFWKQIFADAHCTYAAMARAKSLQPWDQRIYMLQGLCRGQQSGVPAAAERFDEGHGGKKPRLPDRKSRFLIGKQHGFGDDDGGEVDGAGLILIKVNVDLLLRCLARLVGDLLLTRQYTDCGELILHLLKGRQHCLPVAGDALIMGSDCRLDLRVTQARIKNGIRDGAAGFPDLIGKRDREPAFPREAEQAGKAYVWVVKSNRGANQGILLLDSALGRRDVWPPLQQR